MCFFLGGGTLSEALQGKKKHVVLQENERVKQMLPFPPNKHANILPH